jgi:hypothetical protein
MYVLEIEHERFLTGRILELSGEKVELQELDGKVWGFVSNHNKDWIYSKFHENLSDLRVLAENYRQSHIRYMQNWRNTKKETASVTISSTGTTMNSTSESIIYRLEQYIKKTESMDFNTIIPTKL